MPQIPPVEGPQNVTQALDLPTRHYPWLNALLRMVGGETPGPQFGGPPTEYDPAREAMGLGQSMPVAGLRPVLSGPGAIPQDVFAKVLRSFPTGIRRLLTSSKTPEYGVSVGPVKERERAFTEHYFDRPQKRLGQAFPTSGQIGLSPDSLTEDNPFRDLRHEAVHYLQAIKVVPEMGRTEMKGLIRRDPSNLQRMTQWGYGPQELPAEIPAAALEQAAGRFGPGYESPISPEIGNEFIQQLRQAGKRYRRVRPPLAGE